MTFKQAFARARSRGQATFTWNGNRYHTRTAEEESATPSTQRITSSRDDRKSPTTSGQVTAKDGVPTGSKGSTTNPQARPTSTSNRDDRPARKTQGSVTRPQARPSATRPQARPTSTSNRDDRPARKTTSSVPSNRDDRPARQTRPKARPRVNMRDNPIESKIRSVFSDLFSSPYRNRK